MLMDGFVFYRNGITINVKDDEDVDMEEEDAPKLLDPVQKAVSSSSEQIFD